MPVPSLPDEAVLSRDTAPMAEQRQIDAWRTCSTVDIARLINGASRAARELALAGLRARYPSASEEELIARLAVINFGRDLARKVYPQLDLLEP